MPLRLQSGVCADPEDGCGKSFTKEECCVCPQCEELFCSDCWSKPEVHSACKRQDEIEGELAAEEREADA